MECYRIYLSVIGLISLSIRSSGCIYLATEFPSCLRLSDLPCVDRSHLNHLSTDTVCCLHLWLQ